MVRSPWALFAILFVAALTFPGAARAGEDDSDPASEPVVILDLSQYEGQVVYLDFWASWCAPCQQSFPWMMQLQDELADQGLVVITVNVDRDRSAADRFLAQTGSELPVIYDPKGEIAADYELEGMPSSYIYDREGVLRSTHVGFHPDKVDAVEAELQALLAEELSDAEGD